MKPIDGKDLWQFSIACRHCKAIATFYAEGATFTKEIHYRCGKCDEWNWRIFSNLEPVDSDGWQEGTDDMLTNVERVYETRIDCDAERLEAA